MVEKPQMVENHCRRSKNSWLSHLTF